MLRQLIERKGYVNRFEAIRDLVRSPLVEDQWARGDEETVGTSPANSRAESSEIGPKLLFAKLSSGMR